jgi:mannose-1-phosphate guanylyltransferase
LKALLLCAGFGTRLFELTKSTPKPMLLVNGRPLLEYTILHLRRFAVKDLVINLHFFPNKITKFFEDGRRLGVNISYSYEDKPLGTAGALVKAKNKFLNEDSFFVVYGDVITNLDFLRFYSAHKKNCGCATIILHKRRNSNSIVDMNSKYRITNFVERPTEAKKEAYDNDNDNDKWVNSGVYCFDNSIFKYLPDDQFCDFPRDVFTKLVNKKELYGHPLSGYRIAVDSPKRYYSLIEDFKKYNLFDDVAESMV